MSRPPVRAGDVVPKSFGEGDGEIAEELGVSRQEIGKSLREARSKLTDFPRHSEIFNSDVVKIDV